MRYFKSWWNFVIIVAGIALFSVNQFTEYGGRTAGAEARASMQEAMNNAAVAESRYDTAEKAYLDARQDFEKERTLDVAYSDVDKIHKLLNAVSGVKIVETRCVSLQNGFELGEVWQSGMTCDALQFTLSATNRISALRIIARMQLPVYSAVCSESNLVVTVLTGEEVADNA